jgi:UDP-GlcNAc:undecaprenyl-phosphate/decaprenyl-phosphate GlcNAc-1-phosphate transferase
MLALIPVIVASLGICFVLTPFFRDLFAFLGIMDRPDSSRKMHARPIPRVGGVALAVSYLVAIVVLGLGWWKGMFTTQDPSIRLIIKLLPAIVTIFITGLVDDLKGLSPWHKLVGQCAAAALAVIAGVHLATPDGYSVPTLLLDMVSIFWLVLCANAFNLIDGLDGLATGVGLTASISLLMAALIHHNPGLALIITPLIGALLGFLYYNFNPASIFLGDCGSLLVGFLLGCYGLMWNQHATTSLGKAAPLVALAFPVFEVTLSVLRRFLRNRPVFGSDRNHIHHRILSLGLSHRDAALVLCGVSAIVAVLAVLQTILRPQLFSVLFVLALAVAFLGFRALRYPEFGLLGKFIFAGEFRGSFRTRIHLYEYEQSLAAAETVEACWIALRNTCREANFNYVSLCVNGKTFEAELQPCTNKAGRLQVMLSRSDGAMFGHPPDTPMPAMLIAPLAELLQEKLSSFDTVPAWRAADPASAPVLNRSSAAVG